MTNLYDVCADAIIAYLTASMPDVFKKPAIQLSKGDDTILDSGYTYYGILYPGTVSEVPSGSQVSMSDWEVLLDLNCRWNEKQSVAWDNFISFRSDVYNLLTITENGRTLGRAQYVKEVTSVVAEGRPRYIPVRNASGEVVSVAFIAQVLILTVRTSITK